MTTPSQDPVLGCATSSMFDCSMFTNGKVFFRKLAGEGPVKYPPRVNERTSCVGMCHRDRVKGG